MHFDETTKGNQGRTIVGELITNSTGKAKSNFFVEPRVKTNYVMEVQAFQKHINLELHNNITDLPCYDNSGFEINILIGNVTTQEHSI